MSEDPAMDEATIWTRLLWLLRRKEVLALVPVIMLACYWLAGDTAMLAVALFAPLALTLIGALRLEPPPPQMTDPLEGIALRPQLVASLDGFLKQAPLSGLQSGCLVLQFDGAEVLRERHGRAAQAEIIARSAERLCSALRMGDIVARLEGGGFAVVLAPQRRLTLETMIQLSARLQAALAPPIHLDVARIYISCSIGFCLPNHLPDRSSADRSGAAMLDAAQIAADEAQRHGPGAIRAFSPDMPATRADRDAMRALLETALDTGQIVAHFQPQLRTDTGTISGFEVLARWQHPERGTVPPMEFLPALEDAGLSERLAEVMLFQALTALARWDKAGLPVPMIGVNFSLSDLRNPRLVEKLQWELERFDLTPDRLAVEVLENVVASPDDDVVVRNIAALSRLHFGIDLDDFGTGHASITNIRRFEVRRLKIDRSFVTRIDTDPEQQKIVAAILSMAEKLGLDTLAEGVETASELAQIARMGCGHVQGFGIGRPMGFDQATEWMLHHRSTQRPTGQKRGPRLA
ncbi:putative bifunctional diguanylate cyclase/phosphodiesterase [Gemmobacter serpentinus]|uniref:putative bifunctional diguanylate cyclase/phosphodiesterase n=1 Tax=Gemmobacter serpentinus TaxID=2652247 RepID=UPI00124E0BD1|nr:bifunctional diguanylate cyclase/phosphodiesterase [Gemmobacter serpentinus]